MLNHSLVVHGTLSADRSSLVLAPDMYLRVDASYYCQHGFGELGLMPSDISFHEVPSGISAMISEKLSEKTFGHLTMRCCDGEASVDMRAISAPSRRYAKYLVRQGKYKADDLFAFYSSSDPSSDSSSTRNLRPFLGLADVNFEEEYVSKLLGFGIDDRDAGNGHGTVFLSAIEHICAKSNQFMIVHKPVIQAVPFYVKRGYRHLVCGNETYLAKVLNPGFDVHDLMPV